MKYSPGAKLLICLLLITIAGCLGLLVDNFLIVHE